MGMDMKSEEKQEKTRKDNTKKKRGRSAYQRYA